MSLEFRHITSYLLWYCSHHTNEDLLHEVILSIGYFSVLHHDNQMLTQSGQPPTILQQLCALPFQYFSNPRLTNILFPTLISCCYDNQLNREILEQELSCSLLSNFIELVPLWCLDLLCSMTTGGSTVYCWTPQHWPTTAMAIV
ncbi:hypothetical protein NP493_575g01002 [Ridgeia piscesae]|uniref:Uncharacterized protein n=1 Tax=Ridgeia piscesae TaxID=27915 RepID=A0AAD9KUD7_RIDPI|nr:hypothetical protein NP493_575g01002 [Ridgeia piscesae]